MFGMNAELGCEWIFTEWFGINLKGGYKYAKGTGEFKYTVHSDPSKVGQSDEADLDYSGGYFMLGVVFPFGTNSADNVKNEPAKTETDIEPSDDLPPMAQDNPEYQEYIKKGNIEFERKRYKIALTYYEQASEIAQTAEVYKKIGNSNYYLGNKKEAKTAFEKSLKLNPDDTKLKDWLKNYK